METTIVDYGDGIYGIDQQMVRAFLIVGTRKAILLDTGAVRVDIKAFVEELTNLPLMVVLTHGDGDHIGNLQDFSEAYMCEKDWQAVHNHEACAKVKLLPLTDGQVIDLGGRELKVLFTHGHTAGSLSLLDVKNKILFAGDTVSYGPIYMFGERRNLPQYLDTLETLRKMKDEGSFTTVYCCHNTCPICADTVEHLIACVKGIMDQSIAGVPAPMPVPTKEPVRLGKYKDCSVLF